MHLVALNTAAIQQLDLQVQDNTTRLDSAESRLAVLESTTNSLTKANLNVTNTVNTLNLTVTGTTQLASLEVTGITQLATLEVERIISQGNLPTAVLSATTTGQGSTYTIEGNDTAGTVTITTGINYIPTQPSQDTPYPLAAGEQVEVTFDEVFDLAPRVTLTPTSEGSATMGYYVTQSETEFRIVFTEAPASNTEYNFNYQVIQ